MKEDRRLLAAPLAFAALVAACSGGSSGTGAAGSNGATAGMTGTPGSAGNGNSTAGTTGGGNANGTAGTTGAAGSTTAGAAGTSGSAGSTTAGSAGTTGSAGSTTAGSAGASGSAGRGGTTGSAGSTAAGSAGRGGAAGSTSTGTAGTTGAAGVIGTIGPGGAPPACQSPIAITTGSAAAVTANLAMTVRATVSADLMGVHTSVYDANMQLPTTPEYLKAAGVKSLRYPGGSYADLYHWSKHTGTFTPASGAGSNTIFVAPDTHFGAFLTFMEKVGANALITVNYGMNSLGTGGGEPKEAAAWVAYANGSTSSTTNIGADSKGTDWKTVAFWAGLRAAAPLAVDDGYNMFRISHPTPFGIKYWEVGNELYGNGWYYGSCGWEADMHVPYPTSGTCSDRMNNSALSPAAYGTAVKAYSQAMKAVDSTIKIGAIAVAHSDTEYTNWNSMALAAGCSAIDFISVHWYAGTTLTSLATVPETEVPKLFQRAHAATGVASYNCPGGANMPVAITEWGPNVIGNNVMIPMSTADHAPVGSQIVGLFAVESYAQFMEQGAMAAHWLELHNNSYLAGVDATNDPFTMANDSPRWGYHAAQLTHYLAGGGDKMVQGQVTSTTGIGTAVRAHASVHANGDIAVLMTNTNRNTDANVTLTISGGAAACVGKRYAYTPVNTDQDGGLTGDWIFADSAGTTVPVLVPKYSSVVVVFPKK